MRRKECDTRFIIFPVRIMEQNHSFWRYNPMRDGKTVTAKSTINEYQIERTFPVKGQCHIMSGFSWLQGDCLLRNFHVGE